MSVSKPHHVVSKQYNAPNEVAGEMQVDDEGASNPNHVIMRRKSESLLNEQSYIKIGDEMEQHGIMDIQLRDENGGPLGQDAGNQVNLSQGGHQPEEAAVVSQGDQASALSDIESPFMPKHCGSSANFGDSLLILNVQKAGKNQ